LRALGTALFLIGCVLLGACGTIVGFPDRVLDESDASVLEAGDRDDVVVPDASTDTTMPVDAGPARAALSATAVDFGLVSCGAAAPAAKTVTITNSGGQPLTWTAKLAATPDFSITGVSAGTVAPGTFGTVTIASTAVPSVSAAGDTAQAVLTITTNDTATPSVALPIKRTAAGGTLTVVPLTAAFGDTPVGVAAAPIPVSLKNTGNQPVIIGFGPILPAGGGFTLGWTNSPAAVSVAPGTSVASLVASFKPTSKASFAGTSALTVTGALCGTNPTELTMTGNGTDSAAQVQPGSLDFGLVDCGSAPAGNKIKIINSNAAGGAPIHWDAVLTANVSYTLSATTGDVVANSFTEVTVTPNPIPSMSAVTPNLYGDTLTITTNAPGDDPHTVDLLMTAHGAILDASAGSIDFGSVLLSAPATQAFTVSNSGNAPATVSYTTSPAVFSVSPQGQVVGAGTNYMATARFAPTAEQLYSGKATMTVAAGTVLCAPLKPPMNLSGQGAAGAQLSPSSLDFGLVNCGATGTAQKITLTNTSLMSFTWSAALATAYYAITPISGTLAAGASTMITVTPKAIPAASATTADLYADAVTVSIPALSAMFVSSLHMTAKGAILSFNPTPTLDFGNVRVGNSKTKTYAVVNDGNVAAPVTLTKAGAQFSINPNPTLVTVNGASTTAPLNATFNAGSSGTQNGTISVTTTANRCAPLPAALKLTGVGN
jgi:hypothetical protein